MNNYQNNKEKTPKVIEELVERFKLNLPAYKSKKYKEQQLREEFINPFFEALGWDVHNKSGAALAYRDVIHEDSIKMAGGTKAPDYCFTLAGTKMFFVETKKPSVDIKSSVHPSYQLRRYAWSAKLPLSILTDFEEFAVYESRKRPEKSDKASTERITYLTYHDYIERWGEIANIFSKKAVLQGSFDRYIESVKGKRGTQEVDDAFLKEIETWRELLAKNIALQNPELTVSELNHAVQRTIDRIIFLRMCEDRGIEKYGNLKNLLENDNVYTNLCKLYQLSDEKYNSGLFHFKKESGRYTLPDELTLSLTINDKILREIIKHIYYPDSPYEFSVLSPEILGNVYEQFLGKIIRLTKGHRAKIEEKPEVKKAGGVYYTPQHIVNYIVKNTVGKIIEGKTPTKISEMHILDPACGSGSFLLSTYAYLLDYHLKYYTNKKDKRRYKNQIYQGKKGEWFLTINEKKRILLNNIYGLDKDSQAVEVTKLSLLLKVLEGERRDVFEQQQKLFRERALPDLGSNIRCGNSLIGTNFYSKYIQKTFSEKEEIIQINAFDWFNEFNEIMANGGFDVIIGNPPWGANFSKKEQDYLHLKYKAAMARNIDSYAIFAECALSKIKQGGILSFIIPDTILRKDDYKNIRKLFLEETSINELIESGPMFSKVRDTWCLIFNLTKSKPDDKTTITHKKISRFIVSAEERLERFRKGEWHVETKMPQRMWQRSHNMIIGYLATVKEQKIIENLNKLTRLGELKDIYLISRGEEGSKFALKERIDGNFFMVIPENVERFYIGKGMKISNDSLTKTKIKNFYTHPKIWIIRIQKLRWKQRIVCGFDKRTNSAGMKTLQLIISKSDNVQELKYLNAILSSKLINFWCVNYLADDMNKSYLEKIPIRTIDFSNSKDKFLHDKMVDLVERMFVLNVSINKTKVETEKIMLQRQRDATDKQIDQLVYQLYGITEDEKKIIEASV